MAWQLVPEADDRQTVPIDRAILFFGRHPDCDVVITSSRKVSRKHCCVAQVDNQLVVRDLGSMNGVRVNGQAVKGQSALRLGDSLTVGDVVFHLTEVPAKNKRSTPPRSPGKPPRSVSPRDLSQDIPVVISEDGEGFSVEVSNQKTPDETRAPREPIALSDSDIIDDDNDSWFELPASDS